MLTTTPAVKVNDADDDPSDALTVMLSVMLVACVLLTAVTVSLLPLIDTLTMPLLVLLNEYVSASPSGSRNTVDKSMVLD